MNRLAFFSSFESIYAWLARSLARLILHAFGAERHCFCRSVQRINDRHFDSNRNHIDLIRFLMEMTLLSHRTALFLSSLTLFLSAGARTRKTNRRENSPNSSRSAFLNRVSLQLKDDRVYFSVNPLIENRLIRLNRATITTENLLPVCQHWGDWLSNWPRDRLLLNTRRYENESLD